MITERNSLPIDVDSNPAPRPILRAGGLPAASPVSMADIVSGFPFHSFLSSF